MSEPKQLRNPGPTWGYALICLVDRLVPLPVMNVLMDIGGFFALLLMGPQRRHSRRFLSQALGRRATWTDCWKRFAAFSRFLARRFRVAQGMQPEFRLSDHREDRIEALAKAKEQALYGTFHYGNSDLMGFWISSFGRPLRMLREEVGNSDDVRWLEKRFGDSVGFIFVNDAASMLLALKNSIQDGFCVAMKCDRIEYSSKLESFDFMGAKRLFPFTIYHLAILFDLPVAFAIGVPESEKTTVIHSSTIYRPTVGNKRHSLDQARIHFQDTLRLLESLILANPYLWFNFLTENPIAEPAEPQRKSEAVSV